MNETSYQGVEFTADQKAILQRDLDNIDLLTAQLAGIDNSISWFQSKVALGKVNLESCVTSFGAGTGGITLPSRVRRSPMRLLLTMSSGSALVGIVFRHLAETGPGSDSGTSQCRFRTRRSRSPQELPLRVNKLR